MTTDSEKIQLILDHIESRRDARIRMITDGLDDLSAAMDALIKITDRKIPACDDPTKNE